MKTNLKRLINIFLILLTLLNTPIKYSLVGNTFKNDFTPKNKVKSANSDINIITPENKTYAKPMYGYYPGTNGFEHDENEHEPKWFETVFTGGGIVKVIETLDGHHKVLELHDTSETNNDIVAKTLLANPTSGTIEYWIRTNDAEKLCEFRLDGGLILAELIKFRTRFNHLQCWNGTIWNDIASVQSNEWYHIRIDFECTNGNYSGLSQNTWKLYLNGGFELGVFPFINNRNYARIASWYTDMLSGLSDYSYYIDAIGFSWDEFYKVTNNMNEGLFLNFQAPGNLTWIGYSLDGTTNRTILGNITIPKPGCIGGLLHTIQIFGNDSENNVYTSEIRTFKIDNPTFIFLGGMGGSGTGPQFKANPNFFNYYGLINMIGIPYYEGTNSRPEFIGIYPNCSFSEIGGAVKNYIINEHHEGNIKDRIDIVGYSMGGVLARSIIKEYYHELKREGITITHVSICGSPCHGTWGFNMAYWLHEANGTLNEDWKNMQMCTVSSFMRDLNAEDETPYGIYYNTYRGIKYHADKYYCGPFDPDEDGNDDSIMQNLEKYNLTLVNQVDDIIGHLYDGAVAAGSVPLSGALNNRLYFNISHLIIPGIATPISKDILWDLKSYPKSQISTVSPENKTYYEAIDGYFPASNGFENDITSYKPEWFETVFTGGGTARVIETLEGRHKVLELHDTKVFSNVRVAKTFFALQNFGTVEYWMRTDDANKLCGFRLDSDILLTELITLRTRFNQFQYSDGTTWNNITTIQCNEWYHIRIDFECSLGNYQGLAQYEWHIYINGIKYGAYSFVNNLDYARVAWWYTDILYGLAKYYYYIDAIGFSWDPNYNIGDNVYQGLLLSFEKNFEHEWIKYSLDGNSNITILGNKAIALPEEGSHSIQVFYKDCSGDINNSELIYFSIDTTSPSIMINSPRSSELFGKIAPYFSISLNETNLDSMWYKLNDRDEIKFFTYSGQIDKAEWDDCSNGTVLIRFYAKDKGEYEGFSEIIVRKDIINPIISIQSPLINQTFKKPPRFSLIIEESSGLISKWYTIDGGEHNLTFSELSGEINACLWADAPEGRITIRFYAKDIVGNVGYEEITIIKKNPKPEPAIPGYNIIYIICLISIFSAIIIKNKLKE
ncbi:MAG: hypothetical protein ACFE9T_13855 [Promethearchaeota archaeon]